MQPHEDETLRSDIEQALTGGDRRSIGGVSLVVARALRDQSLVSHLVRALRSKSPLVPMRAADALEKLSRRRRNASLLIADPCSARSPARRIGWSGGI